MNGVDVCVRGSGAVGQALALGLARLGLTVTLVAPPATPSTAPRGADVRTYALGARAVALLLQLRVWDALLAATPSAATRVVEMQVDGDAGGHLAFSAWQQGVRELAWIVDAAALERELATALRFAPHVTLATAPVPATLTALCEGADSREREAQGVQMERVDYGQRAIAARLASDRPHHHTARQWFLAPEVLALLPFDLPAAADGSTAAGGYGLVWSVPAARADALMALEPDAFEAALHTATGGAAGRLRLHGERATWPLRLARAAQWHGRGPQGAWVLLGDAAHVVHPLAGQGLNLGLADVDTLCAVFAERQRQEAWRPLDDARLLERYARRRAAPTWAMGQVTDGLLQLFAHPSAPLKELRNRGLDLVNQLSPIKRWLTARALRG